MRKLNPNTVLTHKIYATLSSDEEKGMKIVTDTNVLISGVFFGGFPRKIISSIANRKLHACATVEIIDEYEVTVQEMTDRKQGKQIIPLTALHFLYCHAFSPNFTSVQRITFSAFRYALIS